eukprot:2849477-Rhodomonas_salina.2
MAELRAQRTAVTHTHTHTETQAETRQQNFRSRNKTSMTGEHSEDTHTHVDTTNTPQRRFGARGGGGRLRPARAWECYSRSQHRTQPRSCRESTCVSTGQGAADAQDDVQPGRSVVHQLQERTWHSKCIGRYQPGHSKYKQTVPKRALQRQQTVPSRVQQMLSAVSSRYLASIWRCPRERGFCTKARFRSNSAMWRYLREVPA